MNNNINYTQILVALNCETCIQKIEFIDGVDLGRTAIKVTFKTGGGSAEVVWRYDGKLENVNFLTATNQPGYIVSSHIKKVANIIEKLEDLLPRFS